MRGLDGRQTADDLDQRHDRHRTEEVEPDKLVRPGGRRRELGDTDRGRVRAEQRVRADHPLDRREHRPLGVDVLDDRLDDEIALGQRLEARRPAETAHRGVTLLGRQLAPCHAVAEKPLDPAQAGVHRRLVHFSHDSPVPGLGAHLRDARAHQPTAENPDHLSPRIVRHHRSFLAPAREPVSRVSSAMTGVGPPS